MSGPGEGLGRLFDIGLGWAPVDLDTSNAATGKRVAASVGRHVTFVVVTAAGGATAAEFDLQEHTAYTGGTSRDLDIIDHYYIKSETALDNDEPWVRTAQTAASEVALGTADGDNEYILVIEVDTAQMSADATHLSLNFAATLGAAKLGTCIYLVHSLRYQRKPAKLRNLLNPSATNA